jgi:hypothetical protein
LLALADLAGDLITVAVEAFAIARRFGYGQFTDGHAAKKK